MSELLDLANLSNELDQGRKIVETEAGGVFPAMRDLCAKTRETAGNQGVLSSLEAAEEEYWAKFDAHGIGRTRRGKGTL
jgi:hypothetical protein